MDFVALEGGPRGRIDPLHAAAGLKVEFESELDGCRPAMLRSLEAFNELAGSEITLTLDSVGGSPWVETMGLPSSNLWVDPTTWPGSGGQSILRIVVVDEAVPTGDGSGTFPELPSSAAIWQWDSSQQRWVFPSNVTSTDAFSYLILPLSRSNYPVGSLCTNPNRSPSAEVIAHEIGHALGFGEQRHRTDPGLSVLEAPTAIPNVYDGASPSVRSGVLRLGAYAQGMLREVYAGFNPQWKHVPFNAHDWLLHDEVLRPDLFLPDDRVVGMSTYQFEEINPQHLIFDAGTNGYLDCNTGQAPVFYAQVSEVSSRANWCSPADLELFVDGASADVILDSQSIANECDFAYHEYGYDAVAALTPGDVNTAGYTAPTLTGSLQSITLGMAIEPVADPHGSDNETLIDVVLHPSDTTDQRCASLRERAPSGPTQNARFGQALATTKRDPSSNSPQVVVTGAFRGGTVTVEQHARFGAASGGWGPHEIQGDADDEFGRSVAVDGGGLRVVVGAPATNNDNGAVHVYERVGSAYNLLQTLNPAAPSAGRFGEAVAMTPDRQLLLVGHPRWRTPAGVRVGVVAIHKLDAIGNYSLIQAIHHPNPNDEGALFGAALAATNNWLVIGSPGTDSGTGAAYTVKLNTEAVGAPGGPPERLVANLNPGDDFGRSVSVHQDVLMAGAPGDDRDRGRVWVYARPFEQGYQDRWELATELTAGGASGGRRVSDRYGQSVDNFRGNLLVGAPQRDLGANGLGFASNAGAAFLYRPRVSGDWSVYNAMSHLSGAQNAGDRLGQAVAIGPMYWVLGAPRADDIWLNAGATKRGPYRTFKWYW